MAEERYKGGIGVEESETLNKESGEILTLEQANALQWRELDPDALTQQIEAVWDTVASMQEAQIISNEMLSCEISV